IPHPPPAGAQAPPTNSSRDLPPPAALAPPGEGKPGGPLDATASTESEVGQPPADVGQLAPEPERRGEELLLDVHRLDDQPAVVDCQRHGYHPAVRIADAQLRGLRAHLLVQAPGPRARVFGHPYRSISAIVRGWRPIVKSDVPDYHSSASPIYRRSLPRYLAAGLPGTPRGRPLSSQDRTRTGSVT